MQPCPTCSHPNPDESRFCGGCGARFDQSAGAGLVGQLIADRYLVKRVLAEGGMGVVYEAEQRLGATTRLVAIKTLLPELSRDAKVVERFHRECGVIAQLEHPNTVRVYDFGTTPSGMLYIAMEFVRGVSLGDIIARGPLSVERALGLLEQMCSALEEAHSLGIVHRDLKPDNVVVTQRSGQPDFVKLLDFGIAARSSSGGAHQTKLTQQGSVLGTPPYMSPEQFTGEGIDARTDVYALGVIAYEMLTGHLPFEAESPWLWAHQHMHEPPKPLGVPVPAAVEAAIMDALSKRPDERPASALAFYRRLIGRDVPRTERDAQATSVRPRRVTPTPSPGNAWGSQVLAAADSIPKTDPVASPQGLSPPRTEPSMLAVVAASAAYAAASAAYAPATSGYGAAAHHGAAQAEPRTEPSLLLAAVVAPRTDLPKPSRRRRFPWGWVLVASLGVGGVVAAVLLVQQRRDDDVPRPPPPVATSAAVSGPVVIDALDQGPPLTPTKDSVPQHSSRNVPAPSKPGPATVWPAPSNPTAVPTSTPPQPAANPFPFPIPGFPPLPGTPTVTPPVVPPPPVAPPPVAPPPAATPADCERASQLASTDIDAAVTAYQRCQQIGGAGAGRARRDIASAAQQRARMLANSGQCDEARRVAASANRIGVGAPALREISNSGCGR